MIHWTLALISWATQELFVIELCISVVSCWQDGVEERRRIWSPALRQPEDHDSQLISGFASEKKNKERRGEEEEEGEGDGRAAAERSRGGGVPVEGGREEEEEEEQGEQREAEGRAAAEDDRKDDSHKLAEY